MQFLSLNLRIRMQQNTQILEISHPWGQEILWRQVFFFFHICPDAPCKVSMDINSHEVNKIVHIKSLHGSQMYIQSQAHTRLPCQPQDFSKSDEEGSILHSFVYLVKEASGVRSFLLSLRTQPRASQETQCTLFLPMVLWWGGTMVLPLLAEVKKREEEARKDRGLVMVWPVSHKQPLS